MGRHNGRRTPRETVNGPNVLIVVLDTVRADHVGCYGYSRETTPNIDALAETGLLFERAYAPGTWTPPSHAGLFTGTLARSRGNDAWEEDWIEPWTPTLADVLGAAGYRTALFGGVPRFESDTSLSRGFQFRLNQRLGLPTDRPSMFRADSGRRSRAFSDVKARSSFARTIPWFLEWLDQPSTQPFFAVVHGNDAHFPYSMPGFRRFDADYSGPLDAGGWTQENLERGFAAGAAGAGASIAGGDPGVSETPKSDENNAGATLTERDRRHLVARYDAGIRYADEQVGRLPAELERRGLRENTLLIVLSDHGEALGEKGKFGHGPRNRSLGEELLRVPLLFSYPQRPELRGRRSGPVSLLDVFPTVLEVAGISPSPATQGRSLLDKNASGSDRLIQTAGINGDYALVKGRRKVVVSEGATQAFILKGSFNEEPLAKSAGEQAAREILSQQRRGRPGNAALKPDETPSKRTPNDWNLVLIDLPGLRHDVLADKIAGSTRFVHLRRFASESVVFDRAVAASPWTLPSLASLFTGRHVLSHGVLERDSRLSKAEWTLAETLKAFGYATAAFTGGLDTKESYGLAQGFDLYDDADHASPVRTLLEVAPKAVEWIERNAKRKFFLFLSGYDLHAPWIAPEKFRERRAHEPASFDCRGLTAHWLSRYREPPDGGDVVLPTGQRVAPRALAAHVRLHYTECLSAVDEAFDVIYRALKDNGALNKTLIVLTADHGESLGERGHFNRYRARELRGEVARVPLVVGFPGARNAGRRVNRWTGTVDVMPTLLELLGVTPPARCQGRGVASLCVDESAANDVTTGEAFIVASREVVGLYAGDSLLIAGGPQPPALFSAEAALSSSEAPPGSPYPLLYEMMLRLRDFAARDNLRVPPRAEPRTLDRKLVEDLRKLGYWR